MQYIQFYPSGVASRIARYMLQFLQTISCRLIQRLARYQRSAHSAQHWY